MNILLWVLLDFLNASLWYVLLINQIFICICRLAYIVLKVIKSTYLWIEWIWLYILHHLIRIHIRIVHLQTHLVLLAIFNTILPKLILYFVLLLSWDTRVKKCLLIQILLTYALICNHIIFISCESLVYLIWYLFLRFLNSHAWFWIGLVRKSSTFGIVLFRHHLLVFF